MNSELLLNARANACVPAQDAAVSGRRKFLRSAGALGAASALPVLAGSAGMLLPSVASARISEVLDEYKVKLGTWVVNGINSDVYRNFHIDNFYPDDATRRYQYFELYCYDTYYNAGSSSEREYKDQSQAIYWPVPWRTKKADGSSVSFVPETFVLQSAISNQFSPVKFSFLYASIYSTTRCSTGKATAKQTQGPATLIPDGTTGSVDCASRVGTGAPLFGYVGYSASGWTSARIRFFMLKKTTDTELDGDQNYVFSNFITPAQARNAIDIAGQYSLAAIEFEDAFADISPAFKAKVSFLVGALSKNCTVAEAQTGLLVYAVKEMSVYARSYNSYLTQRRVAALVNLASCAVWCRKTFIDATSGWSDAGWTTNDTWCQGLV